ncbi:tail protein X [Acinetobacter sp. ANC 3781]
MSTVNAIQGDTLDAIAYRYFKDNSVQVLAVLIELNPELHGTFLDEHQTVILPETTRIQSTPSLKLWD